MKRFVFAALAVVVFTGSAFAADMQVTKERRVYRDQEPPATYSAPQPQYAQPQPYGYGAQQYGYGASPCAGAYAYGASPCSGGYAYGVAPQMFVPYGVPYAVAPDPLSGLVGIGISTFGGFGGFHHGGFHHWHR